jgi:hypothetical protein
MGPHATDCQVSTSVTRTAAGGRLVTVAVRCRENPPGGSAAAQAAMVGETARRLLALVAGPQQGLGL